MTSYPGHEKLVLWLATIVMALAVSAAVPQRVMARQTEDRPPQVGIGTTASSDKADLLGQGCAGEICPDASASRSYGVVTVTLVTWMGWRDYWAYEYVKGRNTASVDGTSAGNVNYVQAGGALIRDDDGVDPYSGTYMAFTDTGYIANTTAVDTGWTSEYRGYNDYWIMTGHSYWGIYVGNGYTWESNVFADYHKDF